MSSDIYFNVESWFPGNVRVKPHFKTQCPRIFRPSFGTVVARTCSKFHVRQGVKVTIFHPIKYWSCTIAAQQREEARYTLLVFWNFTLRGLKQKVHISQQKKWHFNFSLILISKNVFFSFRLDVRFLKTYLPTYLVLSWPIVPEISTYPKVGHPLWTIPNWYTVFPQIVSALE